MIRAPVLGQSDNWKYDFGVFLFHTTLLLGHIVQSGVCLPFFGFVVSIPSFV
jgi:hypothetical protein